MEDKTYEDVFAWGWARHEAIIADLRDLVNIPSVARMPDISQKESLTMPFGRECRDALDCILQKAKKYGFSCENYEYYAGAVTNQKVSGGRQVGLWAHLDVVPAGSGWDFPPFQMTQKNGYLIGRGVQDNKSSAVGLLYVLKALKELGLVRHHNYTAYFGCAEEIGMYDARYMAEKGKTPDISIVADCGYPVCYGESGILTMELLSREEIPPQITRFSCGSSGNTVPDQAEIVFADEKCKVNLKNGCEISQRTENGNLHVQARGKAVHVGVSEKGENALYRLLRCIGDVSLIKNYKPLQFPAYVEEKDMLASLFGRRADAQVHGGVTMAGLQERKLSLKLDIRYPILEGTGKVSDGKRLEAYLRERAEECGIEIVNCKNQKPSYFDPGRREAKVLEEAFQKYGGGKAENFCMSGGTYARELKEAFAFGMAMPGKKICPFVTCGGDYHQPNESLEVEGYLKSIVLMILCMAEFDRKV